jgi:hypothetical protein
VLATFLALCFTNETRGVFRKLLYEALTRVECLSGIELFVGISGSACDGIFRAVTVLL